MQGIAGGHGAGGGRAMHPERVNEEAERGSPRATHTRHGPEKTPGDRSQNLEPEETEEGEA
jgi:hypothetical protein